MTIKVYRVWGRDLEAGNNLILDEIHSENKRIPLKLAPLIFFTTIWTHLFGGSAGREGSAVQMGGALSDWVARLFKFKTTRRRSLLIAGLGAGFGAAIGAPLAGAIFGHEVLNEYGFEISNPLPGLVASFSAYFMTLFLGAPHTHYPHLPSFNLDFKLASVSLFAGIIFGVVATLFCTLMHLCETKYKSISMKPTAKIFAAASLLAILFAVAPTFYQGLGLTTIVESLTNSTASHVFFIKLLLTVLTLSIGLKGGEFTPLVFIGTTLGSALAPQLGVSVSFLAVLGFASVFGAAARTPLACAIMLCELFNLSIVPYALISCFAASFVAATLAKKHPHRPRLYKGQRL